jgi:hypothetical protein
VVQLLCVGVVWLALLDGGGLAVIVIALVLSRFPLWGHDLVSTQVMQEWVDNTVSGEVNAMHHALVSRFLYFGFYMVPLCGLSEDFKTVRMCAKLDTG